MSRVIPHLQAQNEMADRMRRLMSPFILRRLKSEVAMQLVSKTHKLVEVSRGGVQGGHWDDLPETVREVQNL
jgi:SNF2 family DNA or RNA helicase